MQFAKFLYMKQMGVVSDSEIFQVEEHSRNLVIYLIKNLRILALEILEVVGASVPSPHRESGESGESTDSLTISYQPTCSARCGEEVHLKGE